MYMKTRRIINQVKAEAEKICCSEKRIKDETEKKMVQEKGMCWVMDVVVANIQNTNADGARIQ